MKPQTPSLHPVLNPSSRSGIRVGMWANALVTGGSTGKMGTEAVKRAVHVDGASKIYFRACGGENARRRQDRFMVKNGVDGRDRAMVGPFGWDAIGIHTFVGMQDLPGPGNRHRLLAAQSR